MASSDLLIRIDGTSAGFDAAASAASKASLRLEAALKTAAVAQTQLNAATAEYGASSSEATTANKAYEASLAKVTRAQEVSSLASKRAAEQQVAGAKAAAAAQEQSAARQSAALKKVGTAYGVVGLAAAAALVGAAKAAADFNAKIAQVQALTRASAGTVQRLADATQNYSRLGVSASDAADAEIELVKAGISVKDILGGALTGTVNLAAAGQIDLGTATSIAAQAMTQFQLKGKDIPHVADLLAAGADRALGSVQDLGEGLKYSGLLAHQSGLSINETVGALSEFAQAGLIGSQGGTALQQVLRQLIAPTSAATEAMVEMGLKTFDSQGHFVGLASVAGQLHDKLGGLTQQQQQVALNTIFTSRAVRGATILFQDGAQGVNSWVQRVNQSGFAAEQASGKMNSLNGDLDKLKAQALNLAISFGQNLQGPLRGVTQDLTSLLSAVDGLPDPIKKGAVELLALTAAVGAGVFVYSKAKLALASFGQTLGVVATKEELAGGAATLTNKKMLAMRGGAALAGIALLGLHDDAAKTNETLGILTTVAGDAALGFAVGGPFGAALGAGVGLLQSFTSASADTSVSVDNLTGTLDKNTGAWTANSEAAARNTASKIATELNTAGISVQTYTHALLGNKTAIDSVNNSIDSATHLTKSFSGATRESRASFDNILGPLQKVREAQDALTLVHQRDVLMTTQKLTPAQEDLANQTRSMGGQMLDTAGDVVHYQKNVKDTASSTADLAAKTDKLTAAIEKLDGKALSRRQAFRDYQDALKTAADSADKLKTALEKTGGSVTSALTPTGKALDAVAQAALSAEGTMHGVALIKFNNDAHDHLVAMAEGFGASHDQAENYAQMVLKTMIPATDQATKHMNDTTDAAKNLGQQQPNVKVSADTAVATAAMVKFERDANTALGHISNETVSVNVVPSAAQVSKVSAQLGLATGGFVSGPGGPTTDSIPAWLSDGEFVVNAAAVQSYGVGLLHAINSQRFAEGGAVGDSASSVGVSVDAGSMSPVAASIQSFADSAASKFGTALNAKAAAQAAKFAAQAPNVGPQGAGVAQWAPVIGEVLSELGQSQSWVGAVESRMARESGGNPTVVNRWDSNWAAGTPSVGLMQVIGPTFGAYAGPYRNTGPFEYGVSVNPLANTYAGLNYGIHRYGGLGFLTAAGGYAAGGPVGRPRGFASGGYTGPRYAMSASSGGYAPQTGPIVGAMRDVAIRVQRVEQALRGRLQIDPGPLDRRMGAIAQGVGIAANNWVNA